MTKPGWEAQDLGDLGEAATRLELTKARIMVRGLSPDGGEDFLIELDGNEAASTGAAPRLALLQVKAREAEESGPSAPVAGIQKHRLLRWSAQQLPVVVVLLAGSERQRWFARLVDDFLLEELGGRDVGDLAQKTVTMRLDGVEDLGPWIRSRVNEFYATRVPDFSKLSATQLREHFEVVESGDPTHYENATSFGRRVIWKGPRRPAFFAALVKELVRQARRDLGGRTRPALVHIHIYRSEADRSNNMAVARVHWLEKEHPRLAPAIADWDELQITASEENDEVRAFWESRTRTPVQFLEGLRPLVLRLDLLVKHLLDVGDSAAWSDKDVSEFKALWDGWHFDIGAVPKELEVLQSFVRGYFLTVSQHETFTLRRDENRRHSDSLPLDEQTRQRWLRGFEDDLRGYLGATSHVARALGFRLR